MMIQLARMISAGMRKLIRLCQPTQSFWLIVGLKNWSKTDSHILQREEALAVLFSSHQFLNCLVKPIFVQHQHQHQHQWSNQSGIVGTRATTQQMAITGTALTSRNCADNNHQFLTNILWLKCNDIANMCVLNIASHAGNLRTLENNYGDADYVHLSVLDRPRNSK